jgi:hypothetical protein
MLARAEPSADEVEAMYAQAAQYEAEIAALNAEHKAQVAEVWIRYAPVHARLIEYKRRAREERLGAVMLEKIRAVGTEYRRSE